MSDTVSIKWTIRSKHSTKSLTDMLFLGTFDYENAIYDRAGQVLDSMLDEITAYMKANAPWTDRTGRARAALQAKRNSESWFYEGSEGRNNTLGIMIGYFNASDPVFYAWYLETKNAGKYQIVLPTLDKFGQDVFNRVRSRLGLR